MHKSSSKPLLLVNLSINLISYSTWNASVNGVLSGTRLYCMSNNQSDPAAILCYGIRIIVALDIELIVLYMLLKRNGFGSEK